MVQGASLTLPALVSLRLITVDDYTRMAETGILTRDDRVELIEGQIIEMPPIEANMLAASIGLIVCSSPRWAIAVS